ncbi:MAG: cold shock domain-containing protein [Planctomycetes bacterium]|nr:cold shock domain-containing protein [Planctomycetota bacterium]
MPAACQSSAEKPCSTASSPGILPRNAEGGGYKSLAEDDAVEFDVEQGPKGPRAVKVTKV